MIIYTSIRHLKDNTRNNELNLDNKIILFPIWVVFINYDF